MTREELLNALWAVAVLLDDKQLERATALLEELAYPERTPPPKLVDDQFINALSHVEFIAELSTKLRTSEESI